MFSFYVFIVCLALRFCHFCIVCGTHRICFMLREQFEGWVLGAFSGVDGGRCVFMDRVEGVKEVSRAGHLMGHPGPPMGPRLPPPVTLLSPYSLSKSLSLSFFWGGLFSPPSHLSPALKCIKQKVHRRKKSVKILKDRKYIRFLCGCTLRVMSPVAGSV